MELANEAGKEKLKETCEILSHPSPLISMPGLQKEERLVYRDRYRDGKKCIAKGSSRVWCSGGGISDGLYGNTIVSIYMISSSSERAEQKNGLVAWEEQRVVGLLAIRGSLLVHIGTHIWLPPEGGARFRRVTLRHYSEALAMLGNSAELPLDAVKIEVAKINNLSWRWYGRVEIATDHPKYRFWLWPYQIFSLVRLAQSRKSDRTSFKKHP